MGKAQDIDGETSIKKSDKTVQKATKVN